MGFIYGRQLLDVSSHWKRDFRAFRGKDPTLYGLMREFSEAIIIPFIFLPYTVAYYTSSALFIIWNDPDERAKLCRGTEIINIPHISSFVHRCLPLRTCIIYGSKSLPIQRWPRSSIQRLGLFQLPLYPSFTSSARFAPPYSVEVWLRPITSVGGVWLADRSGPAGFSMWENRVSGMSGYGVEFL